MPTRYLLIFFTLFVSQSFAQKTILFPIRNGQLWGFIDTNGREVIKPQFRSIGEFAEGLCPARSTGNYGYINNTGKYLIQPQYDYAMPFENGHAQVFIDAKPYIIDKAGKIKFEHNYRKIFPFGKRSYTRVKTHSGKMGVINIKGELVADTIFKEMAEFAGDVSVVTGLNDNNIYKRDTSIKENFEMGLIDSCGKWLIRYGKYDVIYEFTGKYTAAEPYGTHTNRKSPEAIIDLQGNHLFTVLDDKWYLVYNNRWSNSRPYFSDGIAVVEMRSDDPVLKEKYEGQYSGAVNTKGELVFTSKRYEKLTPFSAGRAFALDTMGRWHLVNKKGESVNPMVFEDVYHKGSFEYGLIELPFTDGMAIVKTEKGWCNIDTSGKILTQPQKIGADQTLANEETVNINEILIIQNNKIINQNINERRSPDRFIGVWNINKGIFQYMSFTIKSCKPDDKLIPVQLENNIAAYINQSGKIVWKEFKSKSQNNKLNIDYRLVARHHKSIIGPDTVITSLDVPIVAIKPKNDSLQQPATLIVHHVPYDSSMDYFLLQAKDKNGIWQYIEYSVPVMLGCTFGEEPEEYSKDIWSFDLPAFTGDFKTKMRAKFFYANAATKAWDETFAYSDDIGDYDYNSWYDYLYSNEVDVEINPGQLWRRSADEPVERYR